jgi:hypothetical protein
MSEHERQHQDDELEIEELESVAGGGEVAADETVNNCPITNYMQCNT